MTSRFPTLETALALAAGLSLAAVLLLPPTPYLTPALHPWALGLSGLWTAWCLLRLDQRLAHWRRWGMSPAWTLNQARVPRVSGLLLGKGFRWNATHVQTLETAMMRDGSLPTAPTSRGGIPALHATGHAAERLVVLPETEMVGQMGILGTNRSGKTSLLKLVTVQVIGGQDA
jgi:hypothetical protein